MRILVAAVVILFLVLWVRAVVDVVRRGDLTVSAKAAWAIIMLILPFIGLLLYTMLRPADAQIVANVRAYRRTSTLPEHVNRRTRCERSMRSGPCPPAPRSGPS